MKIQKLSWETAAKSRYTHLVRITFEDFAEFGSASASISIFREFALIPSAQMVRACGMRLITPFNDGSTSSALTVSVGTVEGVDVDRLLDATEIHADGTYVTAKASAVATLPWMSIVAEQLTAVFASTSGDLQDYTVGELEIYYGTFNARLLDVNSQTALPA